MVTNQELYTTMQLHMVLRALLTRIQMVMPLPLPMVLLHIQLLRALAVTLIEQRDPLTRVQIVLLLLLLLPMVLLRLQVLKALAPIYQKDPLTLFPSGTASAPPHGDPPPPVSDSTGLGSSEPVADPEQYNPPEPPTNMNSSTTFLDENMSESELLDISETDIENHLNFW